MTTQQHARGTAPGPATSRAEPRGIGFRDLADACIAQYTGRDKSLCARVGWWVERLGDTPVQDINDDLVFAALEAYASGEALRPAGKDAHGRLIMRGCGRPRTNASVNRMHAALGSLMRFAIRKRLVPRGWPNPTRLVERRPDGPGRVRYLNEAERKRLLAVCRAARWPRLYLLVLMALTTGARRGELLGLHWADIDLERALAHVRTTKNGEPRLLPLTAPVLAELRKFAARAEEHVFSSKRRPGQAMDPKTVWEEALAEARIENFRFHDLRHSCASYLAQNGASLVELADTLGHKTMAMVRRYAHLSTDSKARLVHRVLGDLK